MSQTESPDRAELPSQRLAGAVLALGAVGFIVVFSILAARLGYPDFLDKAPAEVLPALLSGSNSLRIVWAFYALLPMALVFVALRTHGGLGLSDGWQRLTTTGGLVAGFAMSAGLLRWPTLQWSLAKAHAAATEPSTRAALEAVSDALNVTLGNVIGEFTGEAGMTLFFLGIGWSLRSRWVGRASLLLAALLAIGSLRNVAASTQWATEITNGLLPVVMIWIGGAWLLKGLRVHRRVPAAAAFVLVLGAGIGDASALPQREVIVNGFRAPSMGIEFRENGLGFHLGAYPTTLDTNTAGTPRTTWFLKTGVMAYPFQFDTGSGRPSSPYFGVSLVQGLNNAWDVSRATGTGGGVLGEVGFRWAATAGLDVRLGVAVLAGFDGRVHVNPTPGIGWATVL